MDEIGQFPLGAISPDAKFDPVTLLGSYPEFKNSSHPGIGSGLKMPYRYNMIHNIC